MIYPFFDKVRKLLDDKGETVEWLTSKLDKSIRWLYTNKLITGVSLSDILKISALLEFDFLADYNTWLIENKESPISTVREPEAPYIKEKGLTVELKISGSYKSFGENFGELLNTVKKTGDKYGFSIE